MNPEQTNQPKQTFVPPSDRPEVQSASNSCPDDWSVRPLAAILDQQLARTNGLGKVQSNDPNPGLIQKCCEKRRPDLYDLMSSRPPGVRGLESLIEVEAGLTEQLSELSQTASTTVSDNWRASE